MVTGYINVPASFLDKINSEFDKSMTFEAEVTINVNDEMLAFKEASRDKITVLASRMKFGPAGCYLNVPMLRVDNSFQVTVTMSDYTAFFEFKFDFGEPTITAKYRIV